MAHRGYGEPVQLVPDALEDGVAIYLYVMPLDPLDREPMVVLEQGGDEIHFPAALWARIAEEATWAIENGSALIRAALAEAKR